MEIDPEEIDDPNEIYEGNYLEDRDELLKELDDEISEERINNINDKIAELDMKMLYSLRKRIIKEQESTGKILIDTENITDTDLSNFKELSKEIRGKMLDDIIGQEDLSSEIIASMIKLYDILPQFRSEVIYNIISEVFKNIFVERDEALNSLSDTIYDLNRKLSISQKKIIDLDKQVKDYGKQIEELEKKSVDENTKLKKQNLELQKQLAETQKEAAFFKNKSDALELKASLDEMEVEVEKLSLGKRKRSGSDSEEPDKKRDIKENYQDGLTIDNTLNVVFVMLLSSYIALYDGKLPENNLTQTPTNTISDTFKVTLMWWYYNKTNGCFLVTNSGVQRLDGCSDYYGSSIKNQLNCSCGKIGSGLTKPTCDKECFKPYCIGSDNCDKSLTKCSNDQLYQCTGNIGDSNFRYYTYKNNSILSLYSNLLTLQNIFSPDDKSEKSNILLYLFIFIVIILFISGGLYLFKKYKKRKY